MTSRASACWVCAASPGWSHRCRVVARPKRRRLAGAARAGGAGRTCARRHPRQRCGVRVRTRARAAGARAHGARAEAHGAAHRRRRTRAVSSLANVEAAVARRSSSPSWRSPRRCASPAFRGGCATRLASTNGFSSTAPRPWWPPARSITATTSIRASSSICLRRCSGCWAPTQRPGCPASSQRARWSMPSACSTSRSSTSLGGVSRAPWPG